MSNSHAFSRLGWLTAVTVMALGAGACSSSSAPEADSAATTSPVVGAEIIDPVEDVCELLSVADAVAFFNAIVATEVDDSASPFPLPEATESAVTLRDPGTVEGTGPDVGTCIFDVPAGSAEDGHPYGVVLTTGRLGAPVPGIDGAEIDCEVTEIVIEGTGAQLMVLDSVEVPGLGDEARVHPRGGVLCAEGFRARLGVDLPTGTVSGDPVAVEQALRSVAASWGL